MTNRSSSDDVPDLIERLEAGDPPRSPEEAQARKPYERLFERLQDLDEISPPAGWEDRAAARWSSPRRKRRGVGIALTATAVVALAAVILLRPCAAQGPAALEVAVLTDTGSTRRGGAAVGAVLRARARVDRTYIELRIYRGTRLIVRCPGSAQCQRNASFVQVEWALIEPGSYQIVMLSSSSNIPAGTGMIDRDLLDARNAGVSIDSRSLPVAP
jgi:hypothetical protein